MLQLPPGLLEPALPAGSLLGVSYTFSKSLDNSSNYRDIMPDTYYTNNLWGPSEYDTEHILVINYLYDLTFSSRSPRSRARCLAAGNSAAALSSKPAIPAESEPATTTPE